MASSTAMFTALSGLNAHARRLDVIGNNIANVNTSAFKSSRTVFQTMFSRDMRVGMPPNGESGGTDPAQVGMGVRVGAIQRDMAGGTINPTGDPRDLAIDGDGFFVVQHGDQQLYTRDGSFRLDGENVLVSATGGRVQGYPVDANFNVLPGALGDLSVPLGRLTIAEATRNVTVAGNLDASGLLPGQGSVLSLGTTLGGALTALGGLPATATDLLTGVADPADATSTTPLFAAGQTLTLDGATRGDKALEAATLEIDAATTVQDLMDFLGAALGIQATGVPNPDGRTPGVSITAGGVVEIVGNTGTVNAIDLNASDLRLTDAGGTELGSPLFPTTQAEADGESVRTTLVVYDSLGTPLNVDVTLALDARDSTGTTWRYYVDSAGDSDVSNALATGTVRFDTLGQLVDPGPVAIAMDRDGSGAGDPLVFNLRFAGETGRTTSLADQDSEIGGVFRDGLPIGTLESFSVGEDGRIQGAFDNGAIRTLGQVAMATFTNPGGLLDAGGNMWTVGPNAGELIVNAPMAMGGGAIVGGALELSNVDLGKEFIDLITTQTGYSASTRVVRTTDELMQQLLVLGR